MSGRNEEARLVKAVVRFNCKVLGLVLGILLGLSIFVATNIVLLQGGHIDSAGNRVVGPHLQLLSQYLIGYRVSFLGSIVGFVYGFVLGIITGSLLGWIYNKLVDLRE